MSEIKDLTKWWEERKGGYPGSNGDQEDRIICGFKKEDELAIAKAFRELEENNKGICWWIESFEEGDNGLCMLSYGTIKDYDNVVGKYLFEKLNLNNSDYAFYNNYGSNNIWREFDANKCSLVSYFLREYDDGESEPLMYYDTGLVLKDDLTGIEFEFGAGGCVYYKDVQSLLEDIKTIKKADNYKEPDEETIECAYYSSFPEEFYDFEMEEDDKVTGGVEYDGETLAEFVVENGFEPDENGNFDLEKINQALYDCGIMPVKMENGEIHSITKKEETVKYAKARYGEERVSVKVPKSELWNGNDKLLSALQGLREEHDLYDYVDYPQIYIPRYMLGEYLRDEVDINTFLYGDAEVIGYTEEDVEDLCDFIRENYPSYNLNEHSTFKEDTECLLANIKENLGVEISLKEDKPKNKRNKGEER